MASHHLIGAVKAYLLSVQALKSALTGGIHDGQASRDSALPYLVLEAKDSDSLRCFGGLELKHVRVEITAVDTGRASVETVIALVRDGLLPPKPKPARPLLALSDGWRETNCQPAGGESVEIDPETRAALGKDVWLARLPLTITISRG